MYNVTLALNYYRYVMNHYTISRLTKLCYTSLSDYT